MNNNYNYNQLTNEQLVEIFYSILKSVCPSKCHIGRYLKNHNLDLYSEIEKRTIKLNQYIDLNNKNKKYISFFERIYCLEHGLNDRPMCKLCGKKHVAGFDGQHGKYAEYCSSYCQRRSPFCIQHGIQTKKKKYGENDYLCWSKSHKTRIAKYGTHHPKDYPQKVKATKLQKYGNENYVNVEKMLQTVEQNKKENPNYYYDREQKAKQTKVANGHDPNWNNREQFKATVKAFSEERKQSIVEKRKKSCLDLHGYEFPQQSKEVREQTKQTNLDNYGVEFSLQLDSIRNNRIRSGREKVWQLFFSRNYGIEPFISKDDFISNLDLDLRNDLLKWRCKKCGHEFEHVWSNWSRKCPKCFPQNYRGMQSEIANFIKLICPSSTVRFDCKNILKDARQLDIYIEDLKIAIEFNGLFWHNSDKATYSNKKSPMPMMYHYNKCIECESKGIRLVHIFEDEWLCNQRLCKSKLKKIICPNLVYHIDGKACKAIQLHDNMLKLKLLDKYDFYGNDGSSIQYVLQYNNHIVAMMTLSKTRNNQNKYQWQILNYVELNSFIVDSGFATLLQAFKKDFQPQSICMYASYDWITQNEFDGQLTFVEINKPHLYWTHNRIRINGTAINKNNVRTVIKSYDESKTFLQNMNDNGYYRIYDSGTIVFEWRNTMSK